MIDKFTCWGCSIKSDFQTQGWRTNHHCVDLDSLGEKVDLLEGQLVGLLVAENYSMKKVVDLTLESDEKIPDCAEDLPALEDVPSIARSSQGHQVSGQHCVRVRPL